MNDLEHHLARNEDLWSEWEKHGITVNTEFTVDFQFVGTRKKDVESLADDLREQGLEVDVRPFRRLLVFRAWDITASERGTWNLEKIQERSRKYFAMGRKYGIEMDGLGALMPG